MSTNNFLRSGRLSVIVGIVVAIAGLLVLFSLGSKPDTGTALSLPVQPNDWILGSENAPVTLVEYSDFQCPACAAYEPLVTRLRTEFPDTVRLVYRHFPLDQIHPWARLAAHVAEGAGAQGKFWEMHDILLANQSEWSKAPNPSIVFDSYAKRLGLDMEKFARDRDGARENVQDDYESGLSSRVNATPTFFVNGIKINNPSSYEEFRTAITAAK